MVSWYWCKTCLTWSRVVKKYALFEPSHSFMTKGKTTHPISSLRVDENLTRKWHSSSWIFLVEIVNISFSLVWPPIHTHSICTFKLDFNCWRWMTLGITPHPPTRLCYDEIWTNGRTEYVLLSLTPWQQGVQTLWVMRKGSTCWEFVTWSFAHLCPWFWISVNASNTDRLQ